MKSSQRFFLTVLVALSAVTLSGCDIMQTIGEYFTGSKSENQAEDSVNPDAEKKMVKDPNAVIQVDGWSLSSKDFAQRLEALKEVAPDFDVTVKENKKAIAEELINQQILVQEAERMNLSDKPEIKAALEESRRTILIRELANRLTQDIVVSDNEALQFFEDQRQYMVTPTAWRIRAIIVDEKETATKILSDILGGFDFTEQAKLYSKLPGAEENGGDVGFLTAEQIPFPELANEILTLGVGDVSKVFQGPDGFYIIKLEEKRGGDPMAYKDIEEQIKSNLLLQKQQELMIQHTQELRGKSKININENLL